MMSFLKGLKFQISNAALDTAEEQRHQELERLFTSTRAGKHFQKDVVKGVEGIITTGYKQLEVSSKLGEDCKKYSSDGPSVPEPLKRATQQYGAARSMMEKERENFQRSLSKDVSEPLKAMVHGSPLEDARHLKQKYDRLRQDADYQASEVNRRKTKDAGSNSDHVVKLQAAEQKLDDITSAMETMGQNAISALSVVESQQHVTTLQKMLAMVDAERAYVLRVTSILDSLHYEIESEVQKSSIPVSRSSSHGATPSPQTPPATSFTAAREMSVDPPESSYHTSNGSYDYEDSMRGNQQTNEDSLRGNQQTNGGSMRGNQQTNEDSLRGNQQTNGDSMRGNHQTNGEKMPSPTETKSFYATATQNFEGQEYGELSISIGDEVLVQQTIPTGWSEGTCNGQVGWFPSNFVKKKPTVRSARGRPGSRHGSR